MPPGPTSEEIELVSTTVQVLYLQRYSQFIALTITFYDHFTTLDKESQKQRWSKSKVLYLMVPFPLPGPSDHDPGLNWVVFAVLAIGFSCVWGTRALTVIGFILQFRIQALYGSRLLERCLTVVFTCGVICLATVGFLAVDGMEVTSEPVPGIYQCTFVKLPSYAFAFWLPILVFDSLLFLLAVGVVIKNWRLLSPDWVYQSLIAIVLRDNFGYFFFAFAIYLATTVVWLKAETRYFSIPASFSYCVITIMGCRLILNLCDAYHNPDSRTRGTSEWNSRLPWEYSTSGSIKFVAHPADIHPHTQLIHNAGPRGLEERLW
ncbi:hypothetical protein P691DRAFT_787091 [Macrolepiota fuliginosa MF-IS2]|uniref:DUF6533 domain-containing protein n=1 Tax=Macrolepiota fuliginosa MF-IS2 TaxID=1400762 RepID=A0A9P5XHC8_9AGAR|nr:hypothetical protein P691DRAFT_787091 [Macrolepiota fuliginosa MF-IS2]